MSGYLDVHHSLVYWSVSDVAAWLGQMNFPLSVLSDISLKAVNGAELVSLVNQRKLGDINLTNLQAQQLLWSLEKRINQGDTMAGKAVDPTVFQHEPQQQQQQTSGPTEQMAPLGEQAAQLPQEQQAARPRRKKKVQVNLIDLSDGEGGAAHSGHEEDEYEDEEEQHPHQHHNDLVQGGTAGQPLVFEVRFEQNEPPHLLLEEFQPGNRLIVKDFPRRPNGEMGAAERDGRIQVGDFLTAVNGINLDGFPFQEAIRMLTGRKRPMVLRFMRVPQHLLHHNVERWSMHALRSVLQEQGVELSGLEKHRDLVDMVTRAFWEKPMPLPPAQPRVQNGIGGIILGETSICGWLLLKGPHDKRAETRFCDLHGSELLYHRPRPGASAEDGSLQYEEEPLGSIDMNFIKLVETTRTSEQGQKDLRLVDEEGQVWLVSAAGESALNKWHKRFLTAQIVGPGSRTSGQACPSAPFLENRTHNSLYISWLPPRQPYLNTVHSFQVQYREGSNLLVWHNAADEVHSTSLLVKGLKEGEKYVFRVRAMHDKDTVSAMRWGNWGANSQPFVTEREATRPRRPPVHLWVLVHGLKEDISDVAYLGTQIDSRYGADSYVYLAESNAGPFKTLDGIDEGGSRLFEEVMNLVERPMLQTIRKISFVAHGIGGLYVRFALKRLYERGVLSGRLAPTNFVTLGTPHLGTLTASAGVMGTLFEGRTSAQLRLTDGDDRYGRMPLLIEMCGRDYVAALGRFAVRKLYANVRFDSMELYSASIRLDDPFAGMSDMELAARVTPQYTHVLMDADEFAALNAAKGNSPQQQRHMVLPFRPELASQCADRRVWEDAAQSLMDIGWLRVDIYNPKGLTPHKDLVVATVWLNKEGMDIVRHCVDTALT